MTEYIHVFLTALLQTIVIFWPLLFALAAGLAAIAIVFIKLCVRDWTRMLQRTPQLQLYDQEQESAWMPTAPEAWLEYRAFNLRRTARKGQAA